MVGGHNPAVNEYVVATFQQKIIAAQSHLASKQRMGQKFSSKRPEILAANSRYLENQQLIGCF
jgi:hypothetical protein